MSVVARACSTSLPRGGSDTVTEQKCVSVPEWLDWEINPFSKVAEFKVSRREGFMYVILMLLK